MNAIPRQKLMKFAENCRRIADCGLVRCSSGNVSWRIDRTHMLIKSSRAWLSEMSAADVAICRIADGVCLNGRKPSAEVGFHAGILRTRPDVNVVLHFQTPCATTLGCLKRRKVNYFVIPEIPFYIGPVAEVPFLLPGTGALAKAVTAAMRTHNLVQLRNHGQVTAAADFRHAIQNAVFFELACEIILRGGAQVAPMDSQSARLLSASTSSGA
jgi:ribulose-5-phosphate 4-epimerase/fuculose-1-phosphate aldolase